MNSVQTIYMSYFMEYLPQDYRKFAKYLFLCWYSGMVDISSMFYVIMLNLNLSSCASAGSLILPIFLHNLIFVRGVLIALKGNLLTF